MVYEVTPVQTVPGLVDLHEDLPYLMSGTVMELSAMFVDKMTCKDSCLIYLSITNASIILPDKFRSNHCMYSMYSSIRYCMSSQQRYSP